MGLLDGLARHLHDAGLVVFDPDSPAGNTFIDTLPPEPAIAVAVTSYAGPEADSKLGYDEPSVQVTVRAPDPRAGRALAEAIYGELHGLGPLTLPDGPYLLLAVAVQSGPVPLGRDDTGRYRYVVNIRTEIRAATTHRT